jgi:hypothetical protein
MPKLADTETRASEPVVKDNITIEIIHLAMIIFTSFSIPFELGFDCKLYGFLMGMELL